MTQKTMLAGRYRSRALRLDAWNSTPDQRTLCQLRLRAEELCSVEGPHGPASLAKTRKLLALAELLATVLCPSPDQVVALLLQAVCPRDTVVGAQVRCPGPFPPQIMRHLCQRHGANGQGHTSHTHTHNVCVVCCLACLLFNCQCLDTPRGGGHFTVTEAALGGMAAPGTQKEAASPIAQALMSHFVFPVLDDLGPGQRLSRPLWQVVAALPLHRCLCSLACTCSCSPTALV
jgi:hypothetical protein